MPKRTISKNQLSDFWFNEFAGRGHCCICGNQGLIDTRGKVFTAAGVECGALVWCICPNGRTLKRKTGYDKPPEIMAEKLTIRFRVS